MALRSRSLDRPEEPFSNLCSKSIITCWAVDMEIHQLPSFGWRLTSYCWTTTSAWCARREGAARDEPFEPEDVRVATCRTASRAAAVVAVEGNSGHSSKELVAVQLREEFGNP